MKVLGVSGSPRKGKNTDTLLEKALVGAQEAGAKTEFVALRDNRIKPCDACYACVKTGKCHIDDDMQSIYAKLLEADGIILATPVYFWSMSGQLKTFMDRAFAVMYPQLQLANKVGGIVTVGGRDEGGWITSSVIQRYFCINHIFLASMPVIGFGWSKRSVRRDEHAMKAAEELGKQMVSFVKEGVTYPEEYDGYLSRYVAREYEISSCPFE